ncbi:serine protease SohB [Halomonas campaniensis]|uniref:Serine protease SohB n=1 Tax=Halomonas campaniensis TaxID=213554 RepID=A0A7W5K5K2_9GAMM|nr:protease SohB [Halomonas campaniensis]MBB3332371.1 serine protease SohB [Halomonas campaniensis]
MSEWLSDFGMFLAQLVSLVVIVGLAVAVGVRTRGEGGEKMRLRLEELNEARDYRRRRLTLAASEPGERKRLLKSFRRDDKARGKAGRKAQAPRPTVWVLDFHGDIRASGTPRLAEEVSALIDAASEGDEVVVRLESAGGLVHAYGLAAAELDRLREARLTTTVCIDKVAASGGYLMACGADTLRAAPLAVLGSIGVVAQLPNVHRLLKRHDIDVELLTAGRYKRTLTVFGENTEEGREKFIEELESVHELFKRHVAERRPALDIEAVATGETWYGREALAKGLVDTLGTSEAYLVERMKEARVVSVRLEAKRRLGERLGLVVSAGVERAMERGLELLENSRWHRR